MELFSGVGAMHFYERYLSIEFKLKDRILEGGPGLSGMGRA
jgi:hypothetical protein